VRSVRANIGANSAGRGTRGGRTPRRGAPASSGRPWRLAVASRRRPSVRGPRRSGGHAESRTAAGGGHVVWPSPRQASPTAYTSQYVSARPPRPPPAPPPQQTRRRRDGQMTSHRRNKQGERVGGATRWSSVAGAVAGRSLTLTRSRSRSTTEGTSPPWRRARATSDSTVKPDTAVVAEPRSREDLVSQSNARLTLPPRRRAGGGELRGGVG